MARLSAKARSRIYANLEKYARSGMGMEKACDSLLRQPRMSRTERGLYAGILSGLKSGQSIGNALGGASRAVSPLEREVVSASEAGGQLEKGFAHLAEYFRRLDRTRRKILKGLAYPVVLLHLAIPVSTLSVAAFGSFSLDGEGDSTLEVYRTALLDSGKTMLAAYLLLLCGLAFATLLHRAGRTSGPVDALLCRVPLLGSARRAVAMERFSQVFGIFLLSGKRTSDCLEGAALASGSGLLTRAGAKGTKIVAGGNSLASALFAAPAAFPDEFARGIAAAEESGQLDRELDEWGRYYAESASEAMERLGEWAPRLFYWAILLFVGALIIRAALAYRDLLEGVLNLDF